MITQTVDSSNRDILILSDVIDDFCNKSKIGNKSDNCSSRTLIELIGKDLAMMNDNEMDLQEIKLLSDEIKINYPKFIEYFISKTPLKIYFIYSIDQRKIDYVINNRNGTIIFEKDIDKVFNRDDKVNLYLDPTIDKRIYNGTRNRGVKLINYIAKQCKSNGYEFIYLFATPVLTKYTYKLFRYYESCGFIIYGDGYAIGLIDTIITMTDKK